MVESTKIDFQYRRISRLSDYTDLIGMLFPGNRNQQHAAACIFFELKWADSIVPSLAYLETKYEISRRIHQRARAKLARLGLIEHVSYLNSRYGGQHGWKLSSRFETALRQLAEKCYTFRDKATSSEEKERVLLSLVSAGDTQQAAVKPGRQVALRPPAPLRTVLATCIAHGSSISLTSSASRK